MGEDCSVGGPDGEEGVYTLRTGGGDGQMRTGSAARCPRGRISGRQRGREVSGKRVDGEGRSFLRYTYFTIVKPPAEVAELADAPGSGPGSRYGSGGSSPLFGTFPFKGLWR